jgi:hypothetical protein
LALKPEAVQKSESTFDHDQLHVACTRFRNIIYGEKMGYPLSTSGNLNWLSSPVRNLFGNKT